MEVKSSELKTSAEKAQNPYQKLYYRDKSQEEITFCQTSAKMAQDSYNKEFTKEIDGYKQLKQFRREDNNGFKATTYENETDIIIAYAGTSTTNYNEFRKDCANNAQMVASFCPEQYQNAINLYKEVSEYAKDKNKTITVTGHSLGGSLAQLVASTTKHDGKTIDAPKAITFNAYGQKDFIDIEEAPDAKNIFKELNNTTNFFIEGDEVSGITKENAITNQPGEVLEFKTNKKFKKSDYIIPVFGGFGNLTAHAIDNFTDANNLNSFKNAKKLNGEIEPNKPWYTIFNQLFRKFCNFTGFYCKNAGPALKKGAEAFITALKNPNTDTIENKTTC